MSENQTEYSDDWERVPNTPKEQLADCGENFDGYTRDSNGNMIPTTPEGREAVRRLMLELEHKIEVPEIAEADETSERALNPMFKSVIGKTVSEFIRDFDEVLESYKRAKTDDSITPDTLQLSILIASLLSNENFANKLRAQPAFAEYHEISTSERNASLEKSRQRSKHRDELELRRLRRSFPS